MGVSLTAVRRVAIEAQRYASRRRRGTVADVEAAIERLSCVQLDSISTVERSHRIALGGRVGPYPADAVSRLLGDGRLIEYWAHEACLLPADDWPLLRPAMENGGRRWYGQVDRTHPHLREHVLEEIRARGPLGSRHFEGAARQGDMWGWKPAKQMLELLWNHGELVVAGRQGFQRLYDLPERVLPPAVRDAPTPAEPEWLRTLALRAVHARGVLTERGIVEHWRLAGGVARVRDAVASLVAEGALERLAVEDGGAPVLVPSGTDLDLPPPSAAVLLSPFENLLWDRPFARRVFSFDHLIEVYKPAPQRRYGYYVLPFLWRDRMVGRADLKSERATGELVVRAFHREDGVRASGALDDAFDRALDRLRRVIGLETVRAVIALSLEAARRATVAAQLLDGSAPTTVTEVVRALGSVQVDPVASVARAERMVLYSRLGPYDVAELEAALARGELFEYWAHLVATSDYGIHREAMRRYPRGDLTRERYIREWVEANAAFRRYVLREFRRRGPLLSRDLDDRSTVPWRTGGWNDGKGVGRMLDILWFGGEITIVGREGNERVWDLASRRLPQDEPRWRSREIAHAVVERGLRRLGVARRSQFGRMFDGVPPGADAAWTALLREGVAMPVRIDGLDGEWWAHRDVLGRDPGPGRTVLLSPFDRLVYDRDRTAELFGFRYRLEMYVSPAKREYGYYVLPVLHGTELVGRVDATFDRGATVLRVDGVWAERGAPADAGPDVLVALGELARWLGARDVRVGRRVPRRWARALRA